MEKSLAALIVEQYQGGWSLRELAKYHQVGYGSVYRALLKANVPMRPCSRTDKEGARLPLSKQVPSGLPDHVVAQLRAQIGWTPDWKNT